MRKSQSIQEEDEDPGDTGWKEERLESAALIRDNTEIEGESWTTEMNRVRLTYGPKILLLKAHID